MSRFCIQRALAHASVALYATPLVVVALDPSVQAPDWASSAAGVAGGDLIALLSSGLAIDGPPWPQVVLVAVVLGCGVGGLGAACAWRAALAAHVGATLLADGGVWLLADVSPATVKTTLHAPDFGVSVVLTGVLGALARRRAPRLLGAGAAALGLVCVAMIASADRLDPDGLAALEHALGFIIGGPGADRARPP